MSAENQRPRPGGTRPGLLVLGFLALGLVPAAAGCAGSGGGTRYRELTEAWRAEASAPADTAAGADSTPFAGADSLLLEPLVREVLARNPDIESARQGWRAALERYPQATSLPDPTVSYSFAPLSVPSDPPPFGNSASLSQAFPFPGKLGLKGEVALAEAEASSDDYRAVRLRLGTMAASLYYDYYYVHRSLDINAEHIRLMTEFQDIVGSRYETGNATQDELLQAEVEKTHLEHRRLQLQGDHDVVRARLNALLHRAPGEELPAPPDDLELPAGNLPDSTALYATALRDRPELAAAGARIRGGASAVNLAGKAFYPDFSLTGTYNSMWMTTEHQWMLGISMNLPIRRGTRKAAEREARAELARRESDRSGLRDRVLQEVETAKDRYREARRILDLYHDRLLPASRDRVAAARSAYQTGRTTFLNLIDAERNLQNVEEQYQQVLADVYRNHAELLRATGVIPGVPQEGDLR